MGIRGELYTEKVIVENRTYFFNVKENSKGDVFLQVVESKNSEGYGFDRHSIVVFASEMQSFLQSFDKCIEFIEKDKAKKFKEIIKKRDMIKKREDRKNSTYTQKFQDKKYKVASHSDKEHTHKEHKDKKRIVIKKGTGHKGSGDRHK